MTLPFPPPPIAPDPLVVTTMRGFKSALKNREAIQIVEMTRRWLQMEFVLETRITALADYIAAERSAGRTVKLWKIYRLDRYKELLAQVRDEIAEYQRYAADLIARNQQTYAALGIQNAVSAIDATFDSFLVYRASFNILPVSAVEFMIGNAGNGSPLGKLLRDILPDSVDGLIDALSESITLGINPRETARRLKNGFGLGLNRALNIARTEQLRVYRESNRLQYQTSGLVRGYKRLATHDDRVCIGCLLAEGTIYPTENHFEEHPQGRCTSIPLLYGMPDTQWLAGKDYFLSLPPDKQRRLLGSSRYRLWTSGDASLDDMITRTDDPEWGGSIIPTPVYKLEGYSSYDEKLAALAERRAETSE